MADQAPDSGAGDTGPSIEAEAAVSTEDPTIDIKALHSAIPAGYRVEWQEGEWIVTDAPLDPAVWADLVAEHS